MPNYENVDSEQVELAKQFKDFAVNADSLIPIRDMIGQITGLSEDVPGNVSRRSVTYKTRDGHELTSLIYQNTDNASPSPLLFAIHGGGLLMGSPKDNDLRHLRLCSDLGCTIFSAAYRFAPENPFPTPLNDVRDGLSYALKNAGSLNIETSRVALSGDSAGGCLAAGLSQILRDSEMSALTCLFLVYPMLDATTGMETDVRSHMGQHVWTRASNTFGWESYLKGQPKKAPASPSHLEDFRGLPPSYLFVGELDLFFAETITYAQNLLGAGVDARVYTYPKSIHGFIGAVDAAQSRLFNEHYYHAVKKGLEL